MAAFGETMMMSAREKEFAKKKLRAQARANEVGCGGAPAPENQIFPSQAVGAGALEEARSGTTPLGRAAGWLRFATPPASEHVAAGKHAHAPVGPSPAAPAGVSPCTVGGCPVAAAPTVLGAPTPANPAPAAGSPGKKKEKEDPVRV